MQNRKLVASLLALSAAFGSAGLVAQEALGPVNVFRRKARSHKARGVKCSFF